MKQCAPFLRAIQAAPDDVAPKLVFADWLDEQGHGDTAAAVRWCAKWGRWPYKAKGWAWLADTQPVSYRIQRARDNHTQWIPRTVLAGMRAGWTTDPGCRMYRTLFDALVALGRGLRAVRRHIDL